MGRKTKEEQPWILVPVQAGIDQDKNREKEKENNFTDAL